MDHTKTASELDAENKRLRDIIHDTLCIMQDIEEINPSNYDHDLVCRMNSGLWHAYSVLELAEEQGK